MPPILRLGLLAVVTVGTALAAGPIKRDPAWAAVPFTLPRLLEVGTEGSAGLTWTTIDTGGTFEGVVVATWCPACKELLARRAAEPAVREQTRNLFYVEGEVAEQLTRLILYKQLTQEEARAQYEVAVARRQVVFDPPILTGTGARAIRVNAIPAGWLPFFFSCQDGACEGWSGAD